MNKDEILRTVSFERRRTLALLRPLDPAKFDTPTALPGWRIREVIAHLITTDRAAVTGKILPQLFRGSTDGLETWNEQQVPRWADRPVPDLLMALDRWGRRFLRLLRVAPRPLLERRVPTSWGRAPLGLLAWVRAYDEWVHRQDIRRALGLPDEAVDLAGVGDFLLNAIGYDTPRRLPGRTGAVSVSLEGAPLPEWTYDLGTGSAGPSQTEPAAARIAAPAPAFIMAAAGRDSFEDLLAQGALKVEGDQALAREFLSKLRIV